MAPDVEEARTHFNNFPTGEENKELDVMSPRQSLHSFSYYFIYFRGLICQIFNNNPLKGTFPIEDFWFSWLILAYKTIQAKSLKAKRIRQTNIKLW